MRIGLISLNKYAKKLNYACPLHSYAFQQFLLGHGYNSTIIDYKPVYARDFNMRRPDLSYADEYDRLQRKAGAKPDEATRAKLDLLKEKRDAYTGVANEREVRYGKFERFIDTNWVKTTEVYDSDLLEVSDPGFDCYICATDVIWKLFKGEEHFDRGFLLGSKAMEGKYKIAYAASRGPVAAWTPVQQAEFFHYVNDIDYISVREPSLKDFIESKGVREAEVVLDPVLLNDRGLYDSIAQVPVEKGYVFIYTAEEAAKDTVAMAADYARAHDLMVVELSDRPDSHRFDAYGDVKHVFRYEAGIEEWLGYIRDAECVFTNSFHCSCFSILFGKRFYVGSRKGDKIDNLLEETGLTSRRAKSFDEIEAMGDPEIDFAQVDANLAPLRASSERFILRALWQCEQDSHDRYDEWRRQLSYPIIYHSGAAPSSFDVDAFGFEGAAEVEELHFSGNVQVHAPRAVTNDGTASLPPCGFARKDKRFCGWRLRVRIDKRWFWYASGGKLVSKSDGARAAAVLPAGSAIPFIEVNNISVVVAEAVWESIAFTVHLNSGITGLKGSAHFPKSLGETKKLKSGSIELTLAQPVKNDGMVTIPANRFGYHGKRFRGWRLRVKERSRWYWLLEDGSFVPQLDYSAKRDGKRMLLGDKDTVPKFETHDIDAAVFEASWE